MFSEDSAGGCSWAWCWYKDMYLFLWTHQSSGFYDKSMSKIWLQRPLMANLMANMGLMILGEYWNQIVVSYVNSYKYHASVMPSNIAELLWVRLYVCCLNQVVSVQGCSLKFCQTCREHNKCGCVFQTHRILHIN